MTYQPHKGQFIDVNDKFMSDPSAKYGKHYQNLDFNLDRLKQNKQRHFDFQLEKSFISKQKQWLNSIKNDHINFVTTQEGKTVTKPNSCSIANQRRTNMDEVNLGQQNLAKTVKPLAYSYKRLQPYNNPQSFKASTIYMTNQKLISQNQNLQNNDLNLVHKSHDVTEKNAILSIDQIREIQKKQFNQKTIHKITSSASRNKLKSSSSKDSKGSSVNIDTKSIKMNPTTERYNKYINNEIININFDLRKQMPANIIAPNLNARRFGGSEPLSGKFQPTDSQRENLKMNNYVKPQRMTISNVNYDFLTSRPLQQQNKPCQNQSLTHRQTIPRQDNFLERRVKTRSKSNLSMYSQLKSNKEENECLTKFKEKIHFSSPKQVDIKIQNSPCQSVGLNYPPNPKANKRIKFLSYSSDKSTATNPPMEQNKVKKEKMSISFIGNKNNQQNKISRPQTQRKTMGIFNHSNNRSSFETQMKGIDQLIEEKMKQPIRLTLQKRN